MSNSNVTEPAPRMFKPVSLNEEEKHSSSKRLHDISSRLRAAATVNTTSAILEDLDAFQSFLDDQVRPSECSIDSSLNTNDRGDIGLTKSKTNKPNMVIETIHMYKNASPIESETNEPPVEIDTVGMSEHKSRSRSKIDSTNDEMDTTRVSRYRRQVKSKVLTKQIQEQPREILAKTTEKCINGDTKHSTDILSDENTSGLSDRSDISNASSPSEFNSRKRSDQNDISLDFTQKCVENISNLIMQSRHEMNTSSLHIGKEDRHPGNVRDKNALNTKICQKMEMSDAESISVGFESSETDFNNSDISAHKGQTKLVFHSRKLDMADKTQRHNIATSDGSDTDLFGSIESSNIVESVGKSSVVFPGSWRENTKYGDDFPDEHNQLDNEVDSNSRKPIVMYVGDNINPAQEQYAVHAPVHMHGYPNIQPEAEDMLPIGFYKIWNREKQLWIVKNDLISEEVPAAVGNDLQNMVDKSTETTNNSTSLTITDSLDSIETKMRTHLDGQESQVVKRQDSEKRQIVKEPVSRDSQTNQCHLLKSLMTYDKKSCKKNRKSTSTQTSAEDLARAMGFKGSKIIKSQTKLTENQVNTPDLEVIGTGVKKWWETKLKLTCPTTPDGTPTEGNSIEGTPPLQENEQNNKTKVSFSDLNKAKPKWKVGHISNKRAGSPDKRPVTSSLKPRSPTRPSVYTNVIKPKRSNPKNSPRPKSVSPKRSNSPRKRKQKAERIDLISVMCKPNIKSDKNLGNTSEKPDTNKKTPQSYATPRRRKSPLSKSPSRKNSRSLSRESKKASANTLPPKKANNQLPKGPKKKIRKVVPEISNVKPVVSEVNLEDETELNYVPDMNTEREQRFRIRDGRMTFRRDRRDRRNTVTKIGPDYSTDYDGTFQVIKSKSAGDMKAIVTLNSDKVTLSELKAQTKNIWLTTNSVGKTDRAKQSHNTNNTSFACWLKNRQTAKDEKQQKNEESTYLKQYHKKLERSASLPNCWILSFSNLNSCNPGDDAKDGNDDVTKPGDESCGNHVCGQNEGSTAVCSENSRSKSVEGVYRRNDENFRLASDGRKICQSKNDDKSRSKSDKMISKNNGENFESQNDGKTCKRNDRKQSEKQTRYSNTVIPNPPGGHNHVGCSCMHGTGNGHPRPFESHVVMPLCGVCVAHQAKAIARTNSTNHIDNDAWTTGGYAEKYHRRMSLQHEHRCDVMRSEVMRSEVTDRWIDRLENHANRCLEELTCFHSCENLNAYAKHVSGSTGMRGSRIPRYTKGTYKKPLCKSESENDVTKVNEERNSVNVLREGNRRKSCGDYPDLKMSRHEKIVGVSSQETKGNHSDECDVRCYRSTCPVVTCPCARSLRFTGCPCMFQCKDRHVLRRCSLIPVKRHSRSKLPKRIGSGHDDKHRYSNMDFKRDECFCKPRQLQNKLECFTPTHTSGKCCHHQHFEFPSPNCFIDDICDLTSCGNRKCFCDATCDREAVSSCSSIHQNHEQTLLSNISDKNQSIKKESNKTDQGCVQPHNVEDTCNNKMGDNSKMGEKHADHEPRCDIDISADIKNVSNGKYIKDDQVNNKNVKAIFDVRRDSVELSEATDAMVSLNNNTQLSRSSNVTQILVPENSIAESEETKDTSSKKSRLDNTRLISKIPTPIKVVEKVRTTTADSNAGLNSVKIANANLRRALLNKKKIRVKFQNSPTNQSTAMNELLKPDVKNTETKNKSQNKRMVMATGFPTKKYDVNAWEESGPIDMEDVKAMWQFINKYKEKSGHAVDNLTDRNDAGSSTDNVTDRKDNVKSTDNAIDRNDRNETRSSTNNMTHSSKQITDLVKFLEMLQRMTFTLANDSELPPDISTVIGCLLARIKDEPSNDWPIAKYNIREVPPPWASAKRVAELQGQDTTVQWARIFQHDRPDGEGTLAWPVVGYVQTNSDGKIINTQTRSPSRNRTNYASLNKSKLKLKAENSKRASPARKPHPYPKNARNVPWQRDERNKSRDKFDSLRQHLSPVTQVQLLKDTSENHLTPIDDRSIHLSDVGQWLDVVDYPPPLAWNSQQADVLAAADDAADGRSHSSDARGGGSSAVQRQRSKIRRVHPPAGLKSKTNPNRCRESQSHTHPSTKSNVNARKRYKSKSPHFLRATKTSQSKASEKYSNSKDDKNCNDAGSKFKTLFSKDAKHPQRKRSTEGQDGHMEKHKSTKSPNKCMNTNEEMDHTRRKTLDDRSDITKDKLKDPPGDHTSVNRPTYDNTLVNVSSAEFTTARNQNNVCTTENVAVTGIPTNKPTADNIHNTVVKPGPPEPVGMWRVAESLDLGDAAQVRQTIALEEKDHKCRSPNSKAVERCNKYPPKCDSACQTSHRCFCTHDKEATCVAKNSHLEKFRAEDSPRGCDVDKNDKRQNLQKCVKSRADHNTVPTISQTCNSSSSDGNKPLKTKSYDEDKISSRGENTSADIDKTTAFSDNKSIEGDQATSRNKTTSDSRGVSDTDSTSTESDSTSTDSGKTSDNCEKTSSSSDGDETSDESDETSTGSKNAIANCEEASTDNEKTSADSEEALSTDSENASK